MSTLHITNGDCAADTLRRVVPEPVTIMADVLYDGPCPAVDGDAWHQVRAGFLDGFVHHGNEQLRADLAQGDRTVIDACERGDDIVLWFEHDLFDQLELIRTLDLMVRLKPDTTETATPDTTGTLTRDANPVVSGFSRTVPNVSLICIDRFPGIDPFYGLGQLSEDQFATLVGTGVPVTAEHFAIASAAWAAFRSPDPRELLAIPESTALPFLRTALRRFLAEYPSVENGLTRTEQLALDALLAGPMTAGALFNATQSREAQPFLGDLSFFDMLERLASARVPLVTMENGPDGTSARHRQAAITDAGRDVLARRADRVRLNGIDIWRGGVHLAGSDRSPWRWDTRRETLVS